MIVNIPLQIDEQRMEDVIARDYEGKVTEEIIKMVKTTLANRAEKSYGNRVDDGLRVLVEEQINQFLQEHKDDVIDNAAKLIADKLARSKRGKELLGGE